MSWDACKHLMCTNESSAEHNKIVGTKSHFACPHERLDTHSARSGCTSELTLGASLFMNWGHDYLQNEGVLLLFRYLLVFVWSLEQHLQRYILLAHVLLHEVSRAIAGVKDLVKAILEDVLQHVVGRRIMAERLPGLCDMYLYAKS